MNKEPSVIYGDGQQTRDFTYVADVVDANRTLLESWAADGDVLNIGSSDNISIQELAGHRSVTLSSVGSFSQDIKQGGLTNTASARPR